jgi:hypothetical protein
MMPEAGLLELRDGREVVTTRRVTTVPSALGASVKVCTCAGVSSVASHGLVRVSHDQPSGRKSHAVLSEGCGMPGVSGLANMRGPPMSGARAKLPGVVAPANEPGSNAPCVGRAKPGSAGAPG